VQSGIVDGGPQVGKMVRIAKENGLEPATPEEARKLLILKGVEKTRF